MLKFLFDIDWKCIILKMNEEKLIWHALVVRHHLARATAKNPKGWVCLVLPYRSVDVECFC